MGLEELGVALKLDEHIPEVHNNYGVCHIAIGKPELSFPNFARALELRPDFYAVHYQWGYAHALLKNEGAAMREWDLSVRHEPQKRRLPLEPGHCVLPKRPDGRSHCRVPPCRRDAPDPHGRLFQSGTRLREVGQGASRHREGIEKGQTTRAASWL